MSVGHLRKSSMTALAVLGAIAAVNPLPAASQTGRTFASVNGTTIKCAPPMTPPAEMLAAQFDTKPLDLDALSRRASGNAPPDPEFAEFLRQQAERRATDWPYLCRYRDANATLREKGERPKAVFIGDSITEGWIAANPEFFNRNGYVDRGISGQSSVQMLARFYADVIMLRPQVVHIMAGTNDVGGATGPMTEEESVNNIRAMIDMAQANDIRVVLASIPPMSRLVPRPDFNVRPIIGALNVRLRALAADRGVTFVDYHSQLADRVGAFDTRFANDGVHPTRMGYKVMEPLAEQAIERATSTAKSEQK